MLCTLAAQKYRVSATSAGSRSRRNLLCPDKICVACVEKVAFECSSRVERT